MTHEMISENLSGSFIGGLDYSKTPKVNQRWSWDAPFLLCLTFYILHPHPLIRVFRLMSQDRGSSPRWPLGLVNFATASLLQGIWKSLQNSWAGWCWNFTLQIVYGQLSKRIRIRNSCCEAEEMENG